MALVNNSQIESNLRRTASKGLISLLNQEQLINLSLKYFGLKDEEGYTYGYMCPYSGKIYTEYQDIILEHIVPVNSGGGTVLFNCIPTSKEVNGASEKGAKHLIDWWIHSKYWDNDAPNRLEKIVNYMLEAYDKVFEEYTIEEIENSYQDVSMYSDTYANEEDDDLDTSDRSENKKLELQSKSNEIHSYLGFLLDCVNTLEKNNINTMDIRQEVQALEDKNIFKDIERYQMFQNIIQNLMKSRLGDDSRSYLTYALNFDIRKLMDSISFDNEEEIYNELDSRLRNIEQLLKENNLSTIEYFKSLSYIREIDIIYKNIKEISGKEVNTFLENIKIGMDTKIELFIDMLNKGNSAILNVENKEVLEGYPNIKLSHFWNNNKDRIKRKLFEELKGDSKYDTARNLIAINEMTNNVDNQIPIFIDMLNKGNTTILKSGNEVMLEGYSNIKLAYFWSKYKDRIKQKLFVELKDNPEYDMARKLIAINEMTNNVDAQISIFIDMLNKGNSTILRVGNKETLEGYPNIKLSHFWSRHQDRIKQKLFVELKDNPEYDMARKLIVINEMTNNVDNQIPLFIDMLNKGNNKILTRGNEETLESYPNIKLSYFWSEHYDRIEQKLFVELKDNPKYDVARQTVLSYFGVRNYEKLKEKRGLNKSKQELDLDTKISIFIKMLNQGNNKILIRGNNETLEGYSSIRLSDFWHNHQNKIKQKLFEVLINNSEYDIARQTILSYFEVRNYEELKEQQGLDSDTKISIFIKMLNQGNNKILESRNKEILECYPGIKLSHFWSGHKDRIKQKLFVELKDDPKYDTARNLIVINEMTNNVDNQIPIFIDMLNKGNTTILKSGNKEILEGYSNIKLSHFWNNNKDRIKQKLFVELKDNPEYDTARKLIAINEMKINVETQIPIFIDMLNKENNTILKQGNEETLEGYPNIKLARFWGHHKERIKQKLFVELKDNSEYDVARQTLLTYFKVGSYKELEEKSQKSKQLKEDKKMKKQLMEAIEYIDEMDINEQEQRKRA